MALADTARLVASLELQDKFTRPASQIESSMGRLEKGVGRLGRSFDTALGFIGAQVIMRGASSLFNAIKDSAIGMNAELETAQLQFETLLGDADAAQAHVKSLFEFAARTPFETGPIIEASRLMQTFGGALLNTQENLGLVGDAAAATSTPIEEVAFWTSRLYANLQAGRPFGEAAQRLGELGILTPQVRTELEDLQKEGADGTVLWRRYRQELGRFEGAMDRQSRSWKGLTSTIKDNIAILGATSFRPIFDTAKAGMEDLVAFLGSPEATAGAEKFAAKLAEIINPQNLRDAVSDIREIAEEYGPQILQVFQNIPWSTLQTSFTIMSTGSKALLDAFLGLPDWVQTAVATGWGLNKLTGGALSGIGESIFGQFLARGASPANPMWVQSVGGVGPGGPGGPGAGGPNLLLSLISALTGAGIGAGIALPLVQQQNAPAVGFLSSILAAQREDTSIAGLKDSIAKLDEAIAKTGSNNPLNEAIINAISLISGEDTGIIDQLKEQRALLEGQLTKAQQFDHTLRENDSKRQADARQSAELQRNLRSVVEQRGRDQAAATARVRDALQAKKLSIQNTVNVTSNVAITDITRRLVSFRISQGVRGGHTAE